MASPQKEKGYVPIAREIIEALALAWFNPNETKILFVILRKTYGWGKKEDKIPLSQFESATGINRAGVCRSLNSLAERRVISVTKADMGRGRGNVYAIQKDYEKWDFEGRQMRSARGVKKGIIRDTLLEMKKGINRDTVKPVDKPVDNLGKSQEKGIISTSKRVSSSCVDGGINGDTLNRQYNITIGKTLESENQKPVDNSVPLSRTGIEILKQKGMDKYTIKQHYLKAGFKEKSIDAVMGKEF